MIPGSIVRTKIKLPQLRPDLLARPRLLSFLTYLLEYKLIIITAPPGWGKTSLLLQAAYQLEHPVYWYTVDTLDQTPQRFIANFVAAFAPNFEGIEQTLVAVPWNGHLSEIDLEQVVTELVKAIKQFMPEDFVLILDNYHLVDFDRKIGYFISQFIEQVGDNCHLVLASRTMLSLPGLPLLVAQFKVGGLGFDELGFKADEIQALARQNYTLSISNSEAETLAFKTEGWVTIILLLLMTSPPSLIDQFQQALKSGLGLYEFLARQFLSQQSPQMRRFLCHSALCAEFNSDLCESVLANTELYPTPENWAELLATVYQDIPFVLAVNEGETQWLQYHNLFRDFLRERLIRENLGERNLILNRLSEVYTEFGDLK
jgi:LuxR family maltose regulon positive regulatory protein